MSVNQIQVLAGILAIFVLAMIIWRRMRKKGAK